MLILTTPAVEAIRFLTAKPGIPENSGLRIVHQDTGGVLELSITPSPDAEDRIIEADGVRVFLHTEAVAMLSDKALEAEIVDDDDVVFRLSAQYPQQAGRPDQEGQGDLGLWAGPMAGISQAR